ncbi:MAG: hypothetical protein GX456_08140 [Verrucomicrobia bacterium]|nr:hypothetical protein [Verrucomicrobiota bacterium]
MYDLFQSRKSGVRKLTGWGRRRIAALPQCVRKSNGVGSAAVLGSIDPTTNLYDLFQSRKSGVRKLTGWVRRRIAALPQCVRKSNGVGSAAVPGRIKLVALTLRGRIREVPVGGRALVSECSPQVLYLEQ